MFNTTKFLVRFAIAGALACLPVVIQGADARPTDRPLHHVSHYKRHAHRAVSQAHRRQSPLFGQSAVPDEENRSRRYRAHSFGDTSGYPGGNEFKPTAPFGGQAAVTAPPGTDAYEEQMNQRRYFCEYASSRC